MTIENGLKLPVQLNNMSLTDFLRWWTRKHPCSLRVQSTSRPAASLIGKDLWDVSTPWIRIFGLQSQIDVKFFNNSYFSHILINRQSQQIKSELGILFVRLLVRSWRKFRISNLYIIQIVVNCYLMSAVKLVHTFSHYIDIESELN